ncbi:MAG TPA: hypothetical protein HPQ00_17145 [Magnetococcales bacterium]|nr:hypothetical protein [Magnetococcales bacterium]
MLLRHHSRYAAHDKPPFIFKLFAIYFCHPTGWWGAAMARHGEKRWRDVVVNIFFSIETDAGAV